MSQIYSFTLQGLMPSQDSPAYAVCNPVQLPWGGPYGTGGSYAQGLALINVAGTVQSEVFTISQADAVGNIVLTVTADKVYQASFAANASLAVAQAALEGIFGTDCITVTGTPGTTYTCTFSGVSANRRIGTLMSVAASTSGTPTIARTTRGSSGAGQYDVYAGSGLVRGFNQYAFSSDPQGCIVTDIPSTGQPSSMPAWTRGRFWVADLASNFVAGAMSQGNIVFVRGTAITDTGAEIELL